MHTVVIVPGLAESRIHFRRLIATLERSGYTVVVILPWKTDRLEKYRGQAVFVGHSMGAYYISHSRLTPALLIGVVEPQKSGYDFLVSLRNITRHAWMHKDIKHHIVLRLGNLINIARYLPHYMRYAVVVLRNHTLTTRADDVVVVRNMEDLLSITEQVDFHEPGHHDDILYRPEIYTPYIKQLVNFNL